MLAAIGQLAAVLIGIPSLIYLALQIRAQTKEQHQAAVNALTVQWGDLTKALHDSAEFRQFSCAASNHSTIWILFQKSVSVRSSIVS